MDFLKEFIKQTQTGSLKTKDYPKENDYFFDPGPSRALMDPIRAPLGRPISTQNRGPKRALRERGPLGPLRALWERGPLGKEGP